MTAEPGEVAKSIQFGFLRTEIFIRKEKYLVIWLVFLIVRLSTLMNIIKEVYHFKKCMSGPELLI